MGPGSGNMLKRGLILATIIHCIVGPPVEKNKNTGPQQNETTQEWDLGLEYNKYLKEVVQVLESDPEFRKKLEEAKVDEIRDGTIAKELDILNHGVRTKLDEIKRQELERLRHLAQRHFEIPQHLDVKSARFDQEDLMKLIRQTTADLEEQDKKRKEDFKKYEMEKKFEKEMRLNAINDTAERKVV